MYLKYNFKTRGVGLISSSFISKNKYIGNYLSRNETITNESRAIYNGWIETNPLGRYLNHNKNSNCIVKLDGDFIKLYSKTDINKSEELTINYLDVIKLIELPENIIKKYQIQDYEYVTEIIQVKNSLI